MKFSNDKFELDMVIDSDVFLIFYLIVNELVFEDIVTEKGHSNDVKRPALQPRQLGFNNIHISAQKNLFKQQYLPYIF